MNTLRSFIYHKQAESFLSCDDNFSVDTRKKRFAISDGASSGFFSKVYSELLVDKYTKGNFDFFAKTDIESINSDWLNIARYEIEAANNPVTPHRLLVTRQPGCATFIGLNFKKKSWNVSALGDSVLFFISKGKDLPEIQISTYSNPSFSFNPDVIFNNSPLLANSYNTTWCEKQTVFSQKLSEGVFLLMTDATAKWVLKSETSDINKRFERVLNIKTQNEFEQFVNEIREGDAEMDDMTLMIIELNDISNLQFSEINIADYRKYREFNKIIERLKERFIGFKESKEKALQEQKNKHEYDFQSKLNQEKDKALQKQKSELENEFQSEMNQEIEKITKELKEERDNELEMLKVNNDKALQKQKSELENKFQSKMNQEIEKITKELKEERDNELEMLKKNKAIQEIEEESEKKKFNIIDTVDNLTSSKKEIGEIVIETTTTIDLNTIMGETQKKTKLSKQTIVQIIIILLLFVVIGQLSYIILRDKNPISQTQKNHPKTSIKK